jgi:hypothetical protein
MRYGVRFRAIFRGALQTQARRRQIERGKVNFVPLV